MYPIQSDETCQWGVRKKIKLFKIVYTFSDFYHDHTYICSFEFRYSKFMTIRIFAAVFLTRNILYWWSCGKTSRLCDLLAATLYTKLIIYFNVYYKICKVFSKFLFIKIFIKYLIDKQNIFFIN